MWDQTKLHRSRNSGRDFWWNQLPCGPVLTPISCTKLKIHSVHTDSPIVPKQFFFVLGWQFGWGTSLCFTDQKTQEKFFGGTSSLVGQFLHPSPVQSSRSIQCMNTVQLFPKQGFLFFFNLVLGIWMRDPLMLHRSRNSGRDFWWNQLPCGPVLTPISCTKLKIHSALADSLIVPEQVFLKSCTGNLDERPVYASQIKKLW